jgi:hypothetical protein
MTRTSLEPLEAREEAAGKIRAAFATVGVEITPAEALPLGTWANLIDNDLRFQDREALERVEKIRDAAFTLLSAIEDARELGTEDSGSRVNVWTYVVDHPEDLEAVWSTVATLAVRAEESLRVGRRPQGRGRPPNLAYTAFLRDLHALYMSKTGEKGFYRTSGGEAVGTFVDLAVAAQAILPADMHVVEPSTIGNRILAALA